MSALATSDQFLRVAEPIFPAKHVRKPRPAILLMLPALDDEELTDLEAEIALLVEHGVRMPYAKYEDAALVRNVTSALC